MLPYFFGLFSAFCFGISNAFWKTAGKTNSFPKIVFYRGIIATAYFGLAWIILANTTYKTSLTINEAATPLQYLKTILLCLICSLGLVFYLLSLRYSPVSISSPLSSINIFRILTAVFILGETFRTIYYLSFAMGITGILLTQSFKVGEGKKRWNRGADYALLASFFWGVTYALFKFSASWLGAIPLSFLLEGCVTFTAMIWMVFSKPDFTNIKETAFSKNVINYFILAALLLGGTLFFNLAIQRIPVLVISIFENFTIAVSIAAGLIFYKETLTLKQVAGVCLLLGSILIIQIVK